MGSDFTYDVFLSDSAKDKAVVRPLAERLRKDGVKVWFDEWVLKPGDLNAEIRSSRRESAQTSEQPKQRMSGLTSAATREEMIEEGLERSRVLACPAEASARRRMLCMSANAFGSDPATAGLESGTFRFRDWLNKERRFLLLRLDGVLNLRFQSPSPSI